MDGAGSGGSDDVGVGPHDRIMHFAFPSDKCLLHHSRGYGAAVSDVGARLTEVRKARGLDRKTAADALGIPLPTYGQYENGTRPIGKDRAKQIADFFGRSVEWLLFGREPRVPAQLRPPPTIRRRAGRRVVPLVGYVGAGAEAHYYGGGDGELGEVDAPEDSTDDTVAVEVRGTSLGPLFERWLIYYDEVRSPITSDMYGRLCIVGLPDDRVLVKLVRPANTPGFFHLLSNNEPPLTDQEVLWGARVRSMAPR